MTWEARKEIGVRLKGLVVGVTGAGAVPPVPNMNGKQQGHAMTQAAHGTGAKRKRELSDDVKPVPASA